VSFKRWAALNTSVEVAYANGALRSLDVQPPSRAGAVCFARCVANETLACARRSGGAAAETVS
jgi:hypothetical protein